MKKYNKYYEVISKRAWDDVKKSETKHGKNWWGDLPIDDDVNNMPIIENKTCIPNSEWVILHRSIIMNLIDYVNDYPLENEVDSFSLEINFKTGEWRTYLNDLQNFIVEIPDSDVEYSFNTYKCVNDETVLNSYDKMAKEIYTLVKRYITENTQSIDVDITNMYFSIDGFGDSLRLKKWAPGTDSTFSLYSGDDLIVCSM